MALQQGAEGRNELITNGVSEASRLSNRQQMKRVLQLAKEFEYKKKKEEVTRVEI